MLIVDLFNGMPAWGKCVCLGSAFVMAAILVHDAVARAYAAATEWLSGSPDAEWIRVLVPRLCLFILAASLLAAASSRFSFR